VDIGNSINRLAGSRDEGKKELSRVVEKGRDFEWMQGDTMSPKNIPQFLSPKSHQQTKNNSLVVFSGFQLLSTLHQLSMSPWPWWPPLQGGHLPPHCQCWLGLLCIVWKLLIHGITINLGRKISYYIVINENDHTTSNKLL